MVSARPAEIAVDIGELVVRGVPAEHVPAIRAAVEDHLRRLAADAMQNGTVTFADRVETARRLPRLREPFPRLGEAVAGAVWRAVTSPPPQPGSGA